MTKKLVILALALTPVALLGQVRGFGTLNFVPPGGTLVSQNIHPRIWGLTPSNFATIAAKINNYYDADPIASYEILPDSFGTMLDELNSVYGSTANVTNALQYAPAYCLVGHILPFLTTGGGTGITPTHTATEYGEEGARLAVAINTMTFTGGDGNFPYRAVNATYDWCFEWLSAGERTDIGNAILQIEPSCDALYVSWFSADSNKLCSSMFEAAVAMAGDSGAQGTWGTAKLAEYASMWESGDTGIMGSESRVVNLFNNYGECFTSGNAYINYSWSPDTLGTESWRFANTTQTRAQFYLPNGTYAFIASGAYCMNNMLRPFARTLANGFYPNDLVWEMVRIQYTGTDQVGLNNFDPIAMSVMGTIWNGAGDTTTGRLATWLQRNRIPYNYPSTYRIAGYWLPRFTMEDPSISPASPATLGLPLSTRTGDGRWVFRSAWDGDSTTNVNSFVQIYLSNFSVPGDGREAGAWSGHLEMYRKGAGIMSRGPGAHIFPCHGCLNTLYFYDTTRTSPWTSGGQWQSNFNGRANCCYNQPLPSARGADIVLDGSKDYLPTGYVRYRFSAGANTTDYLWGDRTRWYTKTGWYTNADSPAYQTAVKSEFVNFRPPAATGAARVVRREYVINTSNTYIPTMAWNPSADSITTNGSSPTVAGFNNTLSAFGHLKYTNASTLTAESAYNLSGYTTNTKNTLTVVLPSSSTIVIAGGDDENGGECTFTANPGFMDGVTTPNNNASLEAVDFYQFRWTHGGSFNCSDPSRRLISGVYGAFIQPTSVPNGTPMDFLFCYELDDNGSTPGTCVTLTSLTNAIGVQWRDTDQNMIAVFGAAGEDQTTMAFTIPTAGTYQMIVSDLGGSSRTFSSSGCFTATDSSGDTDLTFAVDAASHTIVMTAVTSGANCAVSVN